MEEVMESKKRRASFSTYKRSRMRFYYMMVALPLLQFVVFYLYININSFILGFQEYSYATGKYSFAGLTNFKQIFADFKVEDALKFSVVNSLELYLWTMIFGSAVAIMFSYYIFKDKVGSMLFKIFLYVPHILGGVVIVIMYKYFVEIAIPEVYNIITGEEIKGLLTNSDSRKFMIVFYTIYTSFGTQVLLYSSAMSGISDSIIESAQLDGITPMRELIFIVLPSIWSTFVTFTVSSVIGIFTNQMSLYTFYGDTADVGLYTFGYYLYRETVLASNIRYPYLSAMGLLLTAVAVPLTLFVRWALTKFGPSRD
ncbi:MAG: sugar ABC transporter permease [Clostridia bacterium]|nr:sugar ABC transporter permease [Clostridia bacterium]